MITRRALAEAAAFALAGAICRFLLRYVETRWQIVAFWLVVIAYHSLVRPRSDRRSGLFRLGLDIAAVTVAIIAMKVAIEGRITH